MGGKGRIRTVIGLLLVALGAFLLISLATHDPTEGPFPDYAARATHGNACGAAGAYASAYALVLLGWTAYLVALVVTAAGFVVALRLRVEGPAMRVGGLALFEAALLVGLAMMKTSPAGAAGAYAAEPGLGGGVLGILLAGQLYSAAGPTGTFILVVFALCVGALCAAGAELAAARRWAAERAARCWSWAGGVVRSRRERRAERRAEKAAAARWEAELGETAAEVLRPARLLDPEPEEELPAPEPERADAEPPELEVVTRESRAAQYGAGDDDEEGLELFERTGPFSADDYELPPVRLLEEEVANSPGEDEAEIRAKGRLLEQTLGEFRVEARVVRVQRGPVITMYELSLAPGTKVSKVESLSDDLAIALKAPNVRIVAPLPGKNTVGIEVPNTEREVVGIRELMEEGGQKAAKMAIPLFLGRDAAGGALLLDLARCPHLLVAGATGSGKSVSINAMIISILMTRTPDEVQLLLVDPKSVEFSHYASLPHLICPVLSDMKKAASVLKWACKKMDERYSLLSSVGVRDLSGYNELGEEEICRRLDPEGEAVIDDVPFHMPHIVIIVDEFGELMMVAAKEVEASVIRLSQKARAVGIHLICATQRPSMNVITGLIKSNLPARIAFQVSSKVDSRIILDRNGADLLLGRGDMLLLPPGTSRLVRAQGSYVDEGEISRVVGFLEEQGGPQFHAEIREYHAQQEGPDHEDELFEDAVRVVLETQRGSVSLLQRRLSVGYSRAARLIDMMAEAGIVGPYRGSQARRVLMSLQEWESAHAGAS